MLVVAATVVDSVPARQAVHADAPATEEYWPSVQLMQADAPATEANWPAAQFVHAFVVDPVVPRKVPERQIRHTEDPAAVWYCPLAQETHDDAPAVTLNAPVGQARHVVAPVAGWYVPTAVQALQAVAPITT